jgi:fructose-bisphosphate aldolase class I
MLLKTGMVLPGASCPDEASLDLVAAATLRCLSRTVPAAVPGILFLSGGQQPEIATDRLNAICLMSDGPWTLTFSYGRALQEPALRTWHGLRENAAQSQEELLDRARANSLAVQGICPAEPTEKTLQSTNKQ